MLGSYLGPHKHLSDAQLGVVAPVDGELCKHGGHAPNSVQRSLREGFSSHAPLAEKLAWQDALQGRLPAHSRRWRASENCEPVALRQEHEAVAGLRSPYFPQTAGGHPGRSMVLALVILSVMDSFGSPKVFAADMASPVGRWQLIDDETNSPRGVVEMTQVDGELQGRFVQAFLRPGEDPNALCDKCEGERKNQPMVGMVILWGLRKNSAAWEGGHILDPTSGRIYRVTLKLADGGTKLTVHAFIGFSLLGRTQTWMRLP